MKTNLYLQYANKDILTDDLVQKIKDQWKKQNKRIKDIKELNIYLKPEENKAYYTINQDEEQDFLDM